MKAVTSTDSVNTLEVIKLYMCDWSKQESCEALAKLIAHGKNLKEVDISDQLGSSIGSSIKVELTETLVTITREISGEQVCSTERTNQHQIELIHYR